MMVERAVSLVRLLVWVEGCEFVHVLRAAGLGVVGRHCNFTGDFDIVILQKLSEIRSVIKQNALTHCKFANLDIVDTECLLIRSGTKTESWDPPRNEVQSRKN